MRKVIVAVFAVLFSFGVLGSTHALAFGQVCTPGSVGSMVEPTIAGIVGSQSDMLFNVVDLIDGTVLGLAGFQNTLC